MSLASSLADTACTNIIKTTIIFVHNSFIKQVIEVVQPDKSLFKYHSNSLKHRFKCHSSSQFRKSARAVLLQTGSEITEKEKLLCNTHNDTICHVYNYAISPTRHREIVESLNIQISPRN